MGPPWYGPRSLTCRRTWTDFIRPTPKSTLAEGPVSIIRNLRVSRSFFEGPVSVPMALAPWGRKIVMPAAPAPRRLRAAVRAQAAAFPGLEELLRAESDRKFKDRVSIHPHARTSECRFLQRPPVERTNSACKWGCRRPRLRISILTSCVDLPWGESIGARASRHSRVRGSGAGGSTWKEPCFVQRGFHPVPSLYRKRG